MLFGSILIIAALGLFAYLFFLGDKAQELLSGLPVLYYVLATICGAVLLLATIVNFEELKDAERGAMIGYTVGSVLSMFAVGRVIELLQQIRDK